MRSKCSRRKFIKTASLGATSLAVGGIVQSPRRAWGYVPKDEINPKVSNLRVVYAHDNTMTSGAVLNTWPEQNAATYESVVAANMDKMACALAQKADAAQAWQTIFIKPPSKEWNQVVVAIKVNCIALVGSGMAQTTRNAVMKKMCEVLVNHLGVLGSNIHIYDGIHGNNMTYCWWYDLPSGVTIERRWRTNWVWAPIPPGGQAQCHPNIANGVADILINMTLCKGHDSAYGSFTMCLKNHFGTFEPNAGHGQADYLLNINKSEAILGQMDQGTGRILFPRQQLCLIDALWASRQGPTVVPSHCPNRLFMGTFGPVMDYLVATKFRRDTMGWPINAPVTERFLTDFGYTSPELPDGGAMVDALTWTPPQTTEGANRSWRLYQ